MADCEGTAWDVVGASGSLSQLAGLIAGFVFAGVIVLLSQPRVDLRKSDVGQHHGDSSQQAGSARLRALTPFFATFVAMGLNAYVFALLGGEGAGDCRRVWTAATVASGMLAIGVISTVCGIVLLVRAYLAREHLSSGDTRQLVKLEQLLAGTLHLLCVVVIGLLIQRVYEFLRVWYHGNLHGIEWLALPAALALLAAFGLLVFPPGFMKALRPGPDQNAIKFFDGLLYRAGVGTVLYSVAGTALVGLFLGVIPTEWTAAPAWVPWLVGIVVALGPAVIIACYVLAIRGFRYCVDSGR